MPRSRETAQIRKQTRCTCRKGRPLSPVTLGHHLHVSAEVIEGVDARLQAQQREVDGADVRLGRACGQRPAAPEGLAAHVGIRAALQRAHQAQRDQRLIVHCALSSRLHMP